MDSSRKSRLVASDASPLIHSTLAGYLNLLRRLYDVVIPESGFRETQRYADLPDVIEIASADGTWLQVVKVKDRRNVRRFGKMGLGLGEAEAFALFTQLNAIAVLLTDEDAIKRANAEGIGAMNLADVAKEAYLAKLMSAREVYEFAEILLSKPI